MFIDTLVESFLEELLLLERFFFCFYVAFYSFLIIPALVVIWELIRLFQNKPKSLLLLSIVRIMVTNSTNWFPDHSVERLIMLGWIVYNFTINMIMQSKSTSILLIKTYDIDIDTIEQLVQSNWDTYSFSNNIQAVQDKYHGTEYDNFAQSLIPLMNISEGNMDKLSYSGENMDNHSTTVDYSFLAEHDIAEFVVRTKNYRRNGCLFSITFFNTKKMFLPNFLDRPVFHIVRESIIPSFQSYKLVKGSPLVPVFNKLLRRLEEAGLINFWAQEHLNQAITEGLLHPTDDNTVVQSRDFKALSLKFVAVFFYIWAAGIILAIITFLIECLSCRGLNK